MSLGAAEASSSVLLVDDDPGILDFLDHNLVADRFRVLRAGSAEQALLRLHRECPDAAVVDVTLPGMSGLDLVTAIREGSPEGEWDPSMPVVVLSGLGDPHAAIRGLERGADDYLAKPFHYPELLARLGANLRRARGLTVRRELRVGSLTVDRHSRLAYVRGCPLALSAKEFALLAALAREPRRVLGKRELLRDVWGYVGSARTRTVDSHASRLRRKLAAEPGGEGMVENVWGVGYRLLPEGA